MRKGRIIFIFISIVIIILLSWFIYKKVSERVTAKQIIEESVSIINQSQLSIYYNADDLNQITTKSFEQANDIVLDSEFTFIVWNLEISKPSEIDYSRLKEILNQEQMDARVCFFGKIEPSIIKPIVGEAGLNHINLDDVFVFCENSKARISSPFTSSSMYITPHKPVQQLRKDDLLFQMYIYQQISQSIKK